MNQCIRRDVKCVTLTYDFRTCAFLWRVKCKWIIMRKWKWAICVSSSNFQHAISVLKLRMFSINSIHSVCLRVSKSDSITPIWMILSHIIENKLKCCIHRISTFDSMRLEYFLCTVSHLNKIVIVIIEWWNVGFFWY